MINESNFAAMGHSKKHFYFYNKSENLMVKFLLSQLRAPYILKLAPLSWWKDNFSTDDGRCRDGIAWSRVTTELMQACMEKGEFKGVTGVNNAPIAKSN